MKNKSGIKIYKMSFEGQVLERGFWLYVWKISTSKTDYLYVGRTGDSSSPNAASPFKRIGQHLDFGKNAKGNSMAKNLCKNNINPLDCTFEMFAIGPLFPEQNSKENHYPIRDEMAALEFALSNELKKRNYTVLGTHIPKKSLHKQLFQQVLSKIDDDFPPV
ncbi:hypothetical protein ACFL1G_08475 [Planctomycetota bacterium]